MFKKESLEKNHNISNRSRVKGNLKKYFECKQKKKIPKMKEYFNM